MVISKLIREWSAWWKTQTWKQKTFPALLLALYWVVISRVGTITTEHVFPSLILVLLYYGGPRSRSLFEFFLPLVLMAVIYDSQRYYQDYIRGPIHMREPYEFDKFFFGIQEGGRIIPPAEWFQIHNHWMLDLITGFFYIAFIPMFLGIAAYFRFYLSRTGTAKYSAGEIADLSKQVMWAFLLLNVVGYSTYYWYATSPPWYVQEYGFGPARLDIHASAAGCVRFDKLLGTHIFEYWYRNAVEVHGAIPSLHIAYPLLAAYYAFKFGALQKIAIVFYFWMCFSAVYLNQHYVLDVLVGSLYALGAGWGMDTIWSYRERPISGSEMSGLVEAN